MHVIFIPYGIIQAVEHLKIDMQAQKFPLLMHSPDGKETKSILVQGGLRIAPFGIIDYVFPKEYKDIVMTTLKFNMPDGYKIPKAYLTMVRKALKCKPIPKKIDTKEILPWITQDISLIPIGIREDKTYTEVDGEFKDWYHEAL
jgi:hypothetical protein